MFDTSPPISIPADFLQISFQVNSDLNALNTVLGYFEQFEQTWIPRQDWLQSQLALAEGFTNAVRHAHKGLPQEIPIEIEISLYSKFIEIRIFDRGHPFDLEGFLKNLNQEDLKFSGHGQGLPILKKIAAHLSYQPIQDGRNCLLIVKQFQGLTP